MGVDKELLLKLIAKAHRNTYAAPKEIKSKYKCATPILPGHIDYHFTEGDWEYHDSYAGSQWAPGSEVVLFKGQPIWRMSYQGKTVEGLSKEFIEEAFGFFKKALRSFPDDMPFRGPSSFKEGDFEYIFILNGDYAYFTGREALLHKGKEIFFQNVMGELIK